MKREGRQHGVVSCYRIPPALLSRQRFAKMLDSGSTMGVFAKVPPNPTNQSKFTGKCRKPRCNGCHLHPVSKSKAKAKGTKKLRSIDPQLTKYSFGTSATGVLAYLADDSGYDHNDDHDYYDDRVEENYSYSYSHDYDNDYYHDHNDDDDDNSSHGIDLRVGFGIAVDDYQNEADVGDTDDDEDETMSFCDVGLCWGHGDGDEYVDVDDDGWYIVGGRML